MSSCCASFGTQTEGAATAADDAEGNDNHYGAKQNTQNFRQTAKQRVILLTINNIVVSSHVIFSSLIMHRLEKLIY
mgnify:CR=1 FL=1